MKSITISPRYSWTFYPQFQLLGIINSELYNLAHVVTDSVIQKYVSFVNLKHLYQPWAEVSMESFWCHKMLLYNAVLTYYNLINFLFFLSYNKCDVIFRSKRLHDTCSTWRWTSSWRSKRLSSTRSSAPLIWYSKFN